MGGFAVECSGQLAVITALQSHELFFDRLDVFGQFKERLENLGLSGGVLQSGGNRVHACDRRRQQIALGAE